MKKIIAIFSFIFAVMSAQAQTIIEKDGKPVVKNIPIGYTVEYLAEDSIDSKSGSRYYYVVLRPSNDESIVNDTTRDRLVFRGRAGNLEETKIFRFDRFRDGGTTIIQTLYGVLYFPVEFGSFNEEWKKKPSWNIFDRLIRLDL